MSVVHLGGGAVWAAVAWPDLKGASGHQGEGGEHGNGGGKFVGAAGVGHSVDGVGNCKRASGENGGGGSDVGAAVPWAAGVGCGGHRGGLVGWCHLVLRWGLGAGENIAHNFTGEAVRGSGN